MITEGIALPRKNLQPSKPRNERNGLASSKRSPTPNKNTSPLPKDVDETELITGVQRAPGSMESNVTASTTLSESHQDRKMLDTTDTAKSPKRLLLVSNKCKYGALLEKAVKRNVVAVLYSFENNTFDTLLALVSASLSNGERVTSVGCVMACKLSGLYMLCGNGVFGPDTVVSKTQGIGLFFKILFENFVDRKQKGCRLDFFGAAVVNQLDKNLKEIEKIIGVTIGVTKEPFGIDGAATVDDGKVVTSGYTYFTAEKVRNWSIGSYQTIDLFEKIRMVGKGAFGTAVLYRKKDDNSLVILKEINMTELNSQERQLAMNETKVLKLLNHPNIICYYDTFEENGVLMIEMEYADSGTLAQFLSKQETPISERDILSMFSQIVSGIRYMHEKKVLHRDLKTANIFLTKDGFIKIGDFGVAKIMTSLNDANTVLGTPYYISPEICESKPYNEKSDIWALGCILHEMATRQKTFEGTNLPALVNKIMRGQIAPIQGNFSPEFRQLVNDMLHREPNERPPAIVIDSIRLPQLMSCYDRKSPDDCVSSSNASTRLQDISAASNHETRSVLFLHNISTMTISPIEGFPSKIKIRQVAVGENHFVVVAVERGVYSWGENQHGQLGHGNTEPLAKPQVIEALKGKSVISACCGSSFSVFISDNGIVMTCGYGQHGCLGHGDYTGALRPRLIESLLSVDVTSIACGTHHVIALGSEGEVYAWGDGKNGCLGVGDVDIHVEPVEVAIEGGVTVRDVRCGNDGTMFITDVGTLLACGNNKHNKLGLNERRGFLTALSNKLKKLEVEQKKRPTPVKSIKSVIEVSMGKNHTVVITELGGVHMFGSNKSGQFGTGDSKIHNTPYLVKSLSEYDVTSVICGDTYSAAWTSDGTILLWGQRFKQASEDAPLSNSEENTVKEFVPSPGGHSLSVQPTHRRTHSSASTVSYKSTMSLNQENLSESPSRASSFQDVSSALGSRVPSEFDLSSTASTPTNNTATSFDLKVPKMILYPRPIMNIRGAVEISDPFDSNFDDTSISEGLNIKVPSSNTYPQDFVAFLDCLIACSDNFYMLVQTNSPLHPVTKSDTLTTETPKKSLLKSSISCLNLLVPERPHRGSASSNEAGDEYTSSNSSEQDSFGTAPTWIREELRKTLEAVASETSTRQLENKSDQPVQKRGRSPTSVKASMLSPIKAKSKSQMKKASPSPSRFRSADRSKAGNDYSSSDSSNSNIKRPVSQMKRLSVDAEKPERQGMGRKPRSTSPYVKRSPQANINRLRVNRGRAGVRNWPPANSPKPSKSPIRGNVRGRDLDLQAKFLRLQKEKCETELRMQALQEQNEKHMEEMKLLHEKEKIEHEQKLRNEIALLRKELEQQRLEKEAYDSVLESKQSNGKLRQNTRKSESSFKNSKICNVQ